MVSIEERFLFSWFIFDAFAWRDSTHKNVANQVKFVKKKREKFLNRENSAVKGGYASVDRLKLSFFHFGEKLRFSGVSPASFSRMITLFKNASCVRFFKGKFPLNQNAKTVQFLAGTF